MTERYTPRYGKKETERKIHFGEIGITFGLSQDDETILLDKLMEVAQALNATVVGQIVAIGPDRDGREIRGEPRTYIIRVK